MCVMVIEKQKGKKKGKKRKVGSTNVHPGVYKAIHRQTVNR